MGRGKRRDHGARSSSPALQDLAAAVAGARYEPPAVTAAPVVAPVVELAIAPAAVPESAAITPELAPQPADKTADKPEEKEKKPKRVKSEKIEGFSLYPSDLTWLYGSCPHCFYLKVKKGVRRPGGPMPKIFGTIDTQIRLFCEGKRTDELPFSGPPMPGGVFLKGEEWVRSRNISMLGHKEKFVLRGRPDQTVQWDDGTYGVIDFKTSAITYAGTYARQLETYARAYEEPAGGQPHLAPITKMGLLVFEPEVFLDGSGSLSLNGKVRWIEVERQGADFSFFIDGILTTLESDEAPEPSPDCSFCKYRRQFEPRPEALTHADQLSLLHFE
jgi:hypothetical protein